MHCTSCDSENLGKFKGTIAIHFSAMENLDKPHVYISPDVVVCLDCGIAQFAIPHAQLRLLGKGDTDVSTD